MKSLRAKPNSQERKSCGLGANSSALIIISKEILDRDWQSDDKIILCVTHEN